jgi:hypothetical protein
MPIDKPTPKRIKLKLKDTWYQQNFMVSEFRFVTLGLSAYIDKGQTENEVWDELRLRVHEKFQKDYEAGAFFLPQSTENQPPTLKVEMQIQPINEQIMEITDPVVLKTFETFCKNNPALKELYDKRLKQITNGVF